MRVSDVDGVAANTTALINCIYALTWPALSPEFLSMAAFSIYAVEGVQDHVNHTLMKCPTMASGKRTL